jgi:hypothetical protein
MRKVLLCAISLCLLLVSAPLQAQETPILTRLMRLVPLDQLSGADLIAYVDYIALQKALPDSERPASFEDWRARRDTPSVQWYMEGLRFTVPSDSNLLSASLYGEQMRQSVGFDYYTVDQALSFGTFPNTGRLYTGKFDQAAVQSAFLARDYTRVERDDLIVLCGDPACDADHVFASGAAYDPSNPFGGDRRRRDPLALAEGIIFSAPVMSVFEGMIAAYDDGSPSLLQNDAMRALLNALNAEGTVVQAIFFRNVPSFTDTAGIAPYALGAIVHVLRENGDQPSYIALVYDAQSDVQAIAADLSERVRRAEKFTALIRQSGGSFGAVQIVQAESDAPYVLLLPINSRAPRGIPQGAIATPAPIAVFGNLVFSLQNLYLDFLATSP